MISRRSFLAGSLLSLPGASVFGGIIRSLPIKDSEFTLSLTDDWPIIKVTTFTNGTLTATFDGRAATVVSDGTWSKVSLFGDGNRCEMMVKAPEPGVLCLAWIRLQHQWQTYHDDYVS